MKVVGTEREDGQVMSTRGTEIKKMNKPEGEIVPFSKLFTYADKYDYLLMFLGSLGAIAMGTAQPLQIILFGDTLNAFNPVPREDGTFDPSGMESEINKVVLNFVFLGIGVLFGGVLQVGCWTATAARQSKKLREAYINAIVTQEIGWFDVNDPLTLATKVAESTVTISEGIGRKVGDGINFFSMAVAGVIIGLVKGWKLALTLIAFTPVIALSAFFMMRTLTNAIQSGIEAYGNAGAVAEEALGNIRTVHMFNSIQAIVKKYEQYLSFAEKAGIEKGFAIGWGTGIMFGCVLGTYAFGMWYGTVLIADDQLGETKCTGSSCYNGGKVLTVFLSVIMGAMGLGQAGPSMQAVFSARAAAFEVYRLIERKSSIDASSEEGERLADVVGEITLENVTFHYPSRPHVKVCENYNLKIREGTKIAFVGPSGSGKSTFISLIERFYDPIEGRILLDGKDLKNLNVGWLRQQIGLVGQEPTLFADTIAANIAHGKPGATIEEVHAAAKQANAYDFIMTFPNGFDTEVGERGTQLSGGQKQRIAIARAIIKNPAILLLDEATSALDTESERIVQASLDDLLSRRKRTTIIIAHRLSTIRDADRIIVISNGAIVEDGSHDDLMKLDNGHYKLLVEAQNKTSAANEKAAASDLQAAEAVSGATAKGGVESALFASGKELVTRKQDTLKDEVEVEKKPERKVALKRVWAMSLPEWGYCVIGVLGGLVNGATFPVWGLILTKILVVFFDLTLSADEMKKKGLYWAIAFLILAISFAVSSTVQNYSFAVVSERLTSRLRLQVFKAMLKQEVGWFDLDENSAGALTTRLATDCAIVQSMTSEALNRTVVSLMTLGVAFGIAFYYSWEMTLILMAIFPLMGIATSIQMKLMMPGGPGIKNANENKAGALLSESITAIRTVASFHMEKLLQSEYSRLLQLSSKSEVKTGLTSGFGFGFSQCTLFCITGLLFYIGSKLVTKGTITFEEMFVVIMCIMMGSMGVGLATQNVVESKKAQEAALRIFDTIDRIPLIDATSYVGKKLDKVQGEIELKNLVFAYPNRSNVNIYENYSLMIPSGKTVALVGASGSGKSTAIALIERFYDPQEGQLFLDGHDIRELQLPWLREHVSLVSQEPVLFIGTIADNIESGKPGATRDQIIAAAKMANAHDFIINFPDKYDTQVGDRGIQLSGGQKQRIAIARAILKDPEVLLLDEATSALDNESERIVQESLDRLLALKKRTTIVVAHRLSTIRNADMIAVTFEGKIAEKGTHEELLQIPNGIYKSLVMRQLSPSESLRKS
jgi:ATP-binding cassette subfamily B (MDR/TAP) protein 1